MENCLSSMASWSHSTTVAELPGMRRTPVVPTTKLPSRKVIWRKDVSMATHTIRIDRKKQLHEEPRTGHNRWHPDIPPVLRVDPEDTVVMETRDAFDGIITPDTTVDDLSRLDLNAAFSLLHPLTGPVFVNGAEPGDLLEVHIVDIQPQPFGFTTILPRFGFLRDYFPTFFVVRWSIDGASAVSRDLPGVRIRAGAFMGTMG